MLALIICTQARAEDELSAAETLRPFLKELSREVSTYHYAYRPAMGLRADGPLAEGQELTDAYVQRKMVRYWSLEVDARPYAMVSGLYVAADPVIGRTFGGIGESWALFRIPLRKGFRFVDVRATDREGLPQRLPPDLRAQLRRAGCDAQFPAALLTGLESLACHRIAVRTVKDLDVDGIVYPYQASGFDECRGRSSGAFIVLRTTGLGRALLMTSESPRVVSDDHRIVRGLFELARHAGSFHPSPWPKLETTAAMPDLQTWMREHLFGCGEWPEDKVPNAAEGRPWNDQGTATPAGSIPKARR